MSARAPAVPSTVWRPRAEGAKADLGTLMGRTVAGAPSSYGDREAMLYALSVGFGRDPGDQAERPFVVEHRGLRTVPTLATVVSQTGILQRSDLDFTKVVHAEQALHFLSPLPPAADLLSDAEVVRVVDKGEGKGAYVTTRTRVRDAGTGQPYFESISTILARGDGGIGSAGAPPPGPHELPQRPPDAVVKLATRPDQGLLYRLNGDRNPLHTDADAAARLGLRAPILHGLCTCGIACRAVLQVACGYDTARLASFGGRFSQPVYIGETLATEVWIDGRQVSFRCRAAERNLVVFDRGTAQLNS